MCFSLFLIHSFKGNIYFILYQPEERGDRGEGSRWKTERGADRSRLGRAKNVSQFSWRNLNCPEGALLIGPGRL